MRDSDIQKAKRAAAEKAVFYIQDNMTVGLGTGSTTYYAIQLIGQKISNGLKIKGVPTSVATERLARENNIPLLSEFEQIDLTIDGADEVDKHGNLLKGGGGALTREKIVAATSQREIIIVDESKLVTHLGKFPWPVEVLLFGWKAVQKKLQSLGCVPGLRRADDGIFHTDNQNYILDCHFNKIENPEELAQEINNIPGVVENGLFVGMTELVIVGYRDGGVKELQF
ncbi:MAG: ribose-5-phosphate isomerase RpiA [bacterium]